MSNQPFSHDLRHLDTEGNGLNIGGGFGGAPGLWQLGSSSGGGALMNSGLTAASQKPPPNNRALSFLSNASLIESGSFKQASYFPSGTQELRPQFGGHMNSPLPNLMNNNNANKNTVMTDSDTKMPARTIATNTPASLMNNGPEVPTVSRGEIDLVQLQQIQQLAELNGLDLSQLTSGTNQAGPSWTSNKPNVAAAAAPPPVVVNTPEVAEKDATLNTTYATKGGEVQQNLLQLRQRARQHVAEAIETHIPMEKKAAYLKACKLAPSLVERETDSIQYVRFCNYDVLAAAERLCLYWEEREKLFKDRAFLPMSISGDGALSKDDILSLRAGYPVLLPKNTKTGQQVVFCDRRQYLKTATTETRLRCMFYLATHIAQQDGDSDSNIKQKLPKEDSPAPCAQTEGIQFFVLLIMRPRIESFDDEFVKKLYWLAANVLPIKLNIHLLNCVPNTIPPEGKEEDVDHEMTKHERKRRQREANTNRKKRFAIQDVLSSYLQHIIDNHLQENVEVHIERNPGDLLDELRDLGLEENGIPQCLGGSWKWEQFHGWCRTQAREQKKDAIAKELLDDYQQGRLAGSRSGEDETSKKGEGGSDPTAAVGTKSDETKDSVVTNKQRQQRINNAIHSRRKRERRRQELLDLQQNAERLKSENKRLKLEETRLSGFLAQAHSLVGAYGSTE